MNFDLSILYYCFAPIYCIESYFKFIETIDISKTHLSDHLKLCLARQKSGTLRNIITHNNIMANQKIESFLAMRTCNI